MLSLRHNSLTVDLLETMHYLTQVIIPWPEPARMTSFLAVSLPPDSCRIFPEKTGEFLSVSIGSRRFRLRPTGKLPEFSENIRQESGGKEPVKNWSETVGTGENQRDPTQKSLEPCRPFEVPATGLIDLGVFSTYFVSLKCQGYFSCKQTVQWWTEVDVGDSLFSYSNLPSRLFGTPCSRRTSAQFETDLIAKWFSSSTCLS